MGRGRLEVLVDNAWRTHVGRIGGDGVLRSVPQRTVQRPPCVPLALARVTGESVATLVHANGPEALRYPHTHGLVLHVLGMCHAIIVWPLLNVKSQVLITALGLGWHVVVYLQLLPTCFRTGLNRDALRSVHPGIQTRQWSECRSTVLTHTHKSEYLAHSTTRDAVSILVSTGVPSPGKAVLTTGR